ncbi:hypothetical protein YC2023_020011 [Brassica napus]
MAVMPGGEVPMYFTHRASGKIPCDVEVDACTYEMDHLVLFILHLQIKRVDNSPSELNNNVLLLEFCSHNSQCCGGFYCNRFGCHDQNSTLEAIKGCGARVMRISETDDAEIYEEIIRSKKKLYHKLK